MTADIDPFDQDEGVPRDGRGRPLIAPIVRGKPKPDGKLAAYTRASTFAKALDDGGGLATWKVRHAVVGIAANPDLAAMAAALGTNLNAYDPQGKRDLDAIVDRAHDRSGGNEKADYGTTVHTLTEPDTATDPFALPEPATYLRDVAAYEALLAQLGLEVVATERFVVNDTLKVAGTFDHAYRVTRDIVDSDGAVQIEAGQTVVGDKKTGTLRFLSHVVQLAVYARAQGYDHRTGEREALNLSPTRGLVIHIPKGAGTAAAYVVDLHAGWEAAKLAEKVRALRSGERGMGVLAGSASAPDGEVVVEIKADVTGFAVAVEAAVQSAEKFADAMHRIEEASLASDDQLAVLKTAASAAELPEAPTVDKLAAVVGEAGPELAAEPSIGDAVAVLARAGLQPTDLILEQIANAQTEGDCRAVWIEHTNAWAPVYTDAVKTRLAQLGRAA